MNKVSKNKITLDFWLKLFLVLVLMFGVFRIFVISDSSSAPDNSDTTSSRQIFAKCLNERGVIMYGVDTCEYCETQKKMFGRDFQEIAYVNCDFETEYCRQKGVNMYPVWQIKEKFMAGIQTFESLANESGCAHP